MLSRLENDRLEGQVDGGKGDRKERRTGVWKEDRKEGRRDGKKGRMDRRKDDRKEGR